MLSYVKGCYYYSYFKNKENEREVKNKNFMVGYIATKCNIQYGNSGLSDAKASHLTPVIPVIHLLSILKLSLLHLIDQRLS